MSCINISSSRALSISQHHLPHPTEWHNVHHRVSQEVFLYGESSNHSIAQSAVNHPQPSKEFRSIRRVVQEAQWVEYHIHVNSSRALRYHECGVDGHHFHLVNNCGDDHLPVFEY